MRLRRWRPGWSGRLHATLFRRTILGSSCGLSQLEHLNHLGEPALAELALHAKDLSKLAERCCHALGELRIVIQHGRHCLDRVAFVEKKREELIAHHGLEVRERKSAAGIFAHMLKQAEATFVGDALGHADVEKGADSRLARAALRNVPIQLLDPLGDEGPVDRVDAWPVTWRCVGGLQAS